MSEYEQIIDEIVKHGVVINVNKIVDDNYINGERKYVGCVVGLDFSEHDKVFEDKIELLNRNLNLQKDKRCEVETERNYLAEQINQLEGEIASLKSHMLRLRERCMDGARRHFENGNYGCLTIVNRNGDLEVENEKLKQKISDLESLMQKQDEFLEMKNIQIAELKQRIAELDSKETSELPFDPLECANYLINSTYERESNVFERSFAKLPDKVNDDRYTVDDLEQIAEHLLIYCKHNKESEE